jgi:hypothetical protein
MKEELREFPPRIADPQRGSGDTGVDRDSHDFRWRKLAQSIGYQWNLGANVFKQMAISIPVTLTNEGTAHVATPGFFPPGGTYDAAQSVIISETTSDSSIFYTTDGTTPTTSSPTYIGPIAVSKSETINAIAVAPGYLQSATANAAYKITAPVAPTPGVSQQITITEALAGATVYYTTDGTTPTTKSTKYTGPIALSSSSILKFIAVAPGYTTSNVRTVTTTIQ